MPAARYWRIVGVQTYDGGDLELSELHLYGAAGRLDIGATVSSSHAPMTGTLAALTDDSTETICILAGDAVRAAGFYIMWQFSSDAEVLAIRPGSGISKAKYIERLTLQYQDASGVWLSLPALGKFRWPGAKTMDSAPAGGDLYFASVAALLPMTGSAGSTAFTDLKGNTWTSADGAQISTAHSFFGSGVGVFNGSSRITTPHTTALGIATGDFSIEFMLRLTSVASQIIVNKGVGSGLYAYEIWVSSDNRIGFHGFDSGGQMAYDILGGALALNTDYFVSARRSGSTFTLHANDMLIGVATYAGALRLSAGDSLNIGAYSGGAYGMHGYLGQVRITPGVVRPTTIPTSPWPTAASSGGQEFDEYNLRTRHMNATTAAGSPVSSHSTRRVDPLRLARDVEFGGPGTIYGTTKTKGTPNLPTKARVVLHHQRSKLPVRETWSDPATGYFEFRGIDTSQQFLTLAEDEAGNFRPVAANRLTPEVLP